MKPEAQRIAIARVHQPDLVREHEEPVRAIRKGVYPIVELESLPNYLTDLNAMHEAEKMLDDGQQYTFIYHLCGNSQEQESTIEWRDVHVTAARRAEAFLRTLNLWKD